jgi:hypothetical protein
MDHGYPGGFLRVVLAAFVAGGLSAAPKIPDLKLELLWTGSWEQEGDLINRGDLRLHGFGLTARTQVTDKRPAWENIETGNTAFGGGLYHDSTGSRVLYGIQDERGLPARLRNPWARAIPFAEYHTPMAQDLKTEPSATREPVTYLYLGSPRLGPVKGFASVLLDGEFTPAYGGGMDAQFGKKTNLRFEGFYTERELPPRKSSAWFSETPPLPARDFRFYGANLTFTSPFVGIATDWAYSETFAYGRGLYGNFGVRLGDKPWRFSLAGDGAASRYVDRDGGAAGAGFRAAGRLERRGKRNSLFRLDAGLRAPGLGAYFNRSSGGVYYRLPVSSGNFPVRPSRFSLTLSRNASEKEKTLDSAEGAAGLDLGPVRTLIRGTLTGLTRAGGTPLPNPGKGYGFNSLKISGELSYNLRTLQLRSTLGYTVLANKDPAWNGAVSAAFRFAPGRLSLKLASENFPHEWAWTVSWRLSYVKATRNR